MQLDCLISILLLTWLPVCLKGDPDRAYACIGLAQQHSIIHFVLLELIRGGQLSCVSAHIAMFVAIVSLRSVWSQFVDLMLKYLFVCIINAVNGLTWLNVKKCYATFPFAVRRRKTNCRVYECDLNGNEGLLERLKFDHHRLWFVYGLFRRDSSEKCS